VRTTVSLSVYGALGAFAIGIVIASFRVSPVPPLRWFGATYVELVRNCPLTVLFFLFWFGLPNAGVQFPRFASAVIVLAVYTGAFVAEAIRSGINTVAAGQAEAARSLGLTFPQVLGQVVLPQALRAVVAPLGNVFIALIKNSSIAYTISVVELTGQAQTLAIRTTEVLPVFAAAAVGYLVLTLPSGFAVGWLERKLAIKR
jgi:glutamate transport system permease protein